MFRKSLLVLLVLASATNTYSQIENGNIIFSVNGNYLKSGTDNGMTTNQFKTDNKNLNLGVSIGCFLSNKFITGIGFDYYWINESTISKLYMNNFIQFEKADNKSSILMATIYSGYYWPIVKNLYFSTTLKVNVGKIRSDHSSIVAGNTFNSGGGYYEINEYNSYVRESSASDKSDYFGMGITPEIIYFISGNIGLSLGLGGIEYSMAEWELKNSFWLIDFSPKYWKFGVKIKFNNAT